MRSIRTTLVMSFAGALTLGFLGPVPKALGATINPTVFTDDAAANGNCTLREAIAAADDDMPVDQCPAGSGPDTIVLQPGTYSLTDQAVGSLNITQDLTLTGAGPGVTVVDGAWTGTTHRIFHVIDKPDVVVTFSGLTIQDGSPAAGSGGGILAEANTIVTLDRVALSGNHGSNGGGIVNAGTMTISNSSITGNTSSSCCAAIFNDGGTLTVTDSVISGNTATGSDGGLLNYGTASLTGVTITGNTAGTSSGGISADGPMTTLTNVTISGNSATDEGGGFVGYQASVLNNVTITGNTANSDGDTTGDGGGIYQEGSTPPNVKNSIVAGNTVGAGGQGPDCFGTVTSGGHNLVQNTTGCTGFAGPGDLTGMDPLLGPLADNGGLTQTHALLKGSPAIDAAGTDCAALDQRGLPRGACDIGAYELVLCRKVPVNRIGTEKNDALIGTSGGDGILALGGRDKLRGKGGKDGLCGGPGKDVLKGGGAKDRLDGGPGKDLCVGQAGRDKATACEQEKSIP